MCRNNFILLIVYMIFSIGCGFITGNLLQDVFKLTDFISLVILYFICFFMYALFFLPVLNHFLE